MRDIAPFAVFPQSVALNGFGENDRRRALVLHGGFVGRIDFFRIMPTTPHLPQLFIGKVFGHVP